MRRKHKSLWIFAMAACLTAMMLSLCIGQICFSPVQLLKMIFGRKELYYGIFRYARLPRTLACMLSGAALSVSGAVLQQVLANKLASPGIIGVNAGAGLGVALCCAAGAVSGWMISLSAFVGSLFAMLLVWFLCRGTGASKVSVILSGVALNSILTALTETVSVLDSDAALLHMDFRVGGFSAVSYMRVMPAGILIVLSLAVLLTLCSELDVLSMGDETAQGLGLPVGRYRMIFLVLASVLAGAAVSFSGLLGFVGLIVPHGVRKLSSSQSSVLLPVSAMMGAALVTICDLGARMLFLPYELPVGLLMALVGGPVFVLLLIRRSGGHRHD